MSLLFSAVGCTTAPSRRLKSETLLPAGVYHKVGQGETVWRISKTYGVSLAAIIQANQIPNAAQVEVNQLLLIPGASRVLEIPPVHQPERPDEFIWPLEGKILSYFGEYKDLRINKGIDILAQEGEKVCASREGRVVFADYLNGYGFTLILDHGDDFFTVYARNASLLVKLGDFVLQGAPVAAVGRYDELASLHFQIRKNDLPDNPLYYLP